MIEITKHEYATPNFDHPALEGIVDEYRKYATKRKPEKIYVEMKDVDISVANGLLRYVKCEFPAKALSIDPEEHIATQSPLILPADVKLRLRLVPLDQNCPLDVTFILTCVNMTDEDVFVTTEHLIASDNKKYFPQDIPICMLGPGSYIDIENIRVEQGYGYVHARFCISCNTSWGYMDYVDVFVLKKKKIKMIMITAAEYEEILTAHGPLEQNKFLMIVPYKYYYEFYEKEEIDFIRTYYLMAEIERDIHHIPSTIAVPRQFSMSFLGNGNVNMYVPVISYFSDMITYLMEVDESLAYCEENDTTIHGNIFIKNNEKDTELVIYGHTWTLGEIVKKYTYHKDPNIAYISGGPEHILDNSYMIRIRHTNPIKIIRDAIQTAVIDMSELHSQLKNNPSEPGPPIST
jgi:DNA-directed RNA polymerase subunit L